MLTCQCLTNMCKACDPLDIDLNCVLFVLFSFFPQKLLTHRTNSISCWVSCQTWGRWPNGVRTSCTSNTCKEMLPHRPYSWRCFMQRSGRLQVIKVKLKQLKNPKNKWIITQQWIIGMTQEHDQESLKNFQAMSLEMTKEWPRNDKTMGLQWNKNENDLSTS